MQDDTTIAAHRLTVRPTRLAERLPDGIVLDAAQQSAVAVLEAPHAHGAYLWGGVGRGKSLFAETYFAALPTRRKRRVHFHDFFRDLQAALPAARAPLDHVISDLVGDARAFLFDEFHVHDVADAVYLTAVLRHLLTRDVLLIATSNDAPSQLMPGLWHERFVPAIRLIEEHLDVIPIGAGIDYRGLDAAGRPATGFASGSWILADPSPAADTVLTTGTGIPIAVREHSGDRIRASFDGLCGAPLGTLQYLWLAERTDAVLLEDVPDLATVGREPLLRFCHLIDVLHDRDVRLDVRAEALAERIRDSAVPPVSLERALSRLSLLGRSSG
ncbi:cell division protein ZapE [Microbacterium capsulatum]|uniref:Cell division protein ZapE n=1 Tax=Microbacterium capsulatum TaxID=3041921 RepID=A0ABU0XH87_9MICO|nr:cell division protein ZapE [Microbacterium sp. ASV81]MDQ4214499.1 cell division protein ZapE [Microbacterium sp. ASV81]